MFTDIELIGCKLKETDTLPLVEVLQGRCNHLEVGMLYYLKIKNEIFLHALD